MISVRYEINLEVQNLRQNAYDYYLDRNYCISRDVGAFFRKYDRVFTILGILPWGGKDNPDACDLLEDSLVRYFK